MLEYHIVGPNGSNRYQILDEKEVQVGFIQYKKLFKKNNKKGTPPVFGYHMEIESDIIQYSGTREVNSKIKPLKDMRYFYEFDIKREEDMDHIVIDMSASPYFPYLTLWSKKYGYMYFGIDYEKMYLNFKSKTEHFNTEETLTLKLAHEIKEYEYTLTYCNLSDSLDSKQANTISIEFNNYSSNCCNKEGNLEVVGRKWKNGKFQKECSSVIDATLEEAILTEQDGLNAFNHFRYLIGEILPFKKEIIKEMLEIRGVTELEYLLFMPDLNPNLNQIEENKQKIKSKNKMCMTNEEL